MSDDIETLREFIKNTILSPTAQKLSDRGDTLRALDRLIADRDFCRKAIDNLHDAYSVAIASRDHLRANLERAKEAIDPLCNFAWSAVHADCDESRAYLNNLVGDLRAVLSELSDDAPAQQTTSEP